MTNASQRVEVLRRRIYFEQDSDSFIAAYEEAEEELAEIIRDFPDMKNLSDELRQLQQLGERLVFSEIQLRAKAGQQQLVRSLLGQFPSEEVSGGLLQQIRDLLAKYEAEDHRREALLADLNAQVDAIPDANSRKLAEDFAKEIAAEADADALRRLASFGQ